jgi:hypothetical protein
VIDLTHQKVNLLLVSLSLGHVLGHAKKQSSSIRLGSQCRANKAPKAIRAVFGADRHFSQLRLTGVEEALRNCHCRRTFRNIGLRRLNVHSWRKKTEKPEEEVAQIAVPPIVETEEFEAVQQFLRERSPQLKAPAS